MRQDCVQARNPFPEEVPCSQDIFVKGRPDLRTRCLNKWFLSLRTNVPPESDDSESEHIRCLKTWPERKSD